MPRDWGVAIATHAAPRAPQCERDRRARCPLIVGYVPLLPVRSSRRRRYAETRRTIRPRDLGPSARRNAVADAARSSSSGSPPPDPRRRSLAAAKTRGLRGDRTPAKCRVSWVRISPFPPLALSLTLLVFRRVSHLQEDWRERSRYKSPSFPNSNRDANVSGKSPSIPGYKGLLSVRRPPNAIRSWNDQAAWSRSRRQ